MIPVLLVDLARVYGKLASPSFLGPKRNEFIPLCSYAVLWGNVIV